MAPAPYSERVTQLLAAAGRGDAEASERLFSIVYDELRRLADSYMRRERPDHTLQPTALVHEAYLRLLGSESPTGEFRDRHHFVATAAVAMRRILVNHAKAKKSQKRGGARPVLALDDATTAFSDRAIDLLVLDEAMTQLAELDAEQARLVELRFFGGLTIEQCADVMHVSPRKLKYDWAHARAWLRSRLESA